MKKTIIELIKNKNIKELINLIKEDASIDLNIKDDTYNYFIYYVLLLNDEELLDIVLERDIRLDILDTDGRNILYIPIKFAYTNLLVKILRKDSVRIGIPIIDIKDKLGLIALHYAIIFNNFDAFKLLITYNSNILITNNTGLSAFHICIQYNRIKFFLELLSLVQELNIMSSNNETLLQFAIIHNRFDFIPLVLKKKILINNKESTNGLVALHEAIIKKNINLVREIINYGANINSQDYSGNTALHYAISEDNKSIIELILKFNPEYDLTNIDGNTALHNYLDTSYLEKDILSQLISKTDLNIQNNQGITCLKRLVDLYIIDNYATILKHKELNFFIQDNTNEDMSASLNDKHILDVAVDSYYNMIKKNKEELIIDWEKWCSVGLLEKLKTINKHKNEAIHICKDKIREVIIKEKRSLPKLSDFNLILDNGIFINTCYYTGLPLDILFGLVYLKNTFSTIGLDLVLDYPLTVSLPLEQYYQKIGIDYPFKLEFSNCEIIWSFQKLFYPSYFDIELDKLMNNKYTKYITIPIGIELSNGSHANILFIDIKNKTVERFEPNGGANNSLLNYNPELLDELLKQKFSQYALKYFKPSDFLPTIGFQMLENAETAKCKRIGDPNGFCGIWCTWWVFHRLKNIDISNKDLAIKLIKNIKLENKNFRTLIRNFSSYITELRDKALKKYNIDINDWMVNNTNVDIINGIEKDILKMIQIK